MNKLGLLLSLAAVCSLSSVLADTCTKDASVVFSGINFVDMEDECVKETEEQIKKEITASVKYLHMAAHFARDSVNRPGFAKMFFEAASEEREHAYKLIEYLSMRGRYLREKSPGDWKSSLPGFDISQLIKSAEDSPVLGVTLEALTPKPDDKTTSGLIALQNALKLETAVTKSIRRLVQKCEGGANDYHFVDYLTSEFLEEQYKGQRDLAGKISTLGKMVKNQGSELADFLFDKQLL